MLNLPNYYLGENLYQGTRTLVYRGQRICDKKPVIIKVLRNPHPSFNELVQFRNQYIITCHLKNPAIVQPLALERYGNSYALVMLDNGAMGLCEYWSKSEPSLSNFLHIGIQLAEALHYLSIQRIIHKDIKPSNILIHPETKQVQLIDFSISTLLPKEQQQLINPNVLEGTLAYISPEQTGRMNRGIDYRTDFYSLGVTFFELLTGKLPFTTTDVMELVHCHIAKMPRIENTEEIPLVLSDMILKLMAKNAEDRYQSALGIKHDLEQCLEKLEATGEIKRFELGSRDLCDRFIIPEKLYGRESEVQKLLDGFALVAEGATLMMLVAGFSGIGKTAVVNEVHKPIVKQRGYFIKGKFDQFNRNIPFSAFVQAFRDLMGQLLGESDAELALWKSKILDAVGENGQVIIDVVPEVEKIIGTQPAATELSGTAAQNRFNLLFGKFVQVFTSKEHPLVIFLDDLQWADSASLNLLKLLMEESEAGYLLLLGAYRDNEVFPGHPLMLSLDEINKQGANIETLTLAPLSEKDITSLVAETLLCSVELAAPLSQLVYQKTKGNPFFTTQFLKGLYEDGCIRFEADAGYWQCNLAEVRQLALTDDVVEFMVGRLQKLPKANQNVLKLAACIGNQFDLAILAVVCEETQDELAGNLWRGLQEGFIIPKSDTYKFFQGGEQQGNGVENVSVNYRFLHDRVQQAAYSLIPEGQKQATHLHIGRTLSQKLSQQQQDTNVFTIVNHWNQAIELITDLKERDNLIQLNLSAGEKAKGSAAYGAALKYFQTALSLLELGSWQTNYPLALKLHENYAEAAYLTGDFELMETTIEQIVASNPELLDLVKVHEIKIQAKMAQTQQLSAVNIGIEFLGLLGLDVPESPLENLQVELGAISQLMEGKAIATLADLPLMEDGKQLAKIKIMENLLTACYQAQPSLFPWLVCKLMQLSVEYGNTIYSSHIYCCYGIISILVLQDFTAGTEYGKLACQLDLNPQTGDGVAGTHAVGICIKHYSTHVREAIPLLLKTYQIGLEIGSLQFAGVSMSYRSQYFYLTGYNLSTVKQEMATASHALATIKQENALAWNQGFEQGVLNLLGESKTPWELIGTAYNETQSIPFQISANDRTALHFVYLNKLILCYLFEQIPQAVENAALAESYLDGVPSSLAENVCNFYDSLTQLAHYGNTEISVQKSILEKVETNQNKMQYWATYAPMNGQHKYDLVAAECKRVLGKEFEAINLYDCAIAGAKENEYLQEEALANELAAKFCLEWGQEKFAQTYMIEAYYCYARWGAKAKINQLEEKYPQLLTPILQQQQVGFNPLDSIERFTQTLTSKSTTQTTSTRLSDTLDLGSLLQSAQAISSIIELEPLLSQILQIILTNAGAQKAVLIIPEIDQWQLRAIAEVTTDGTIETDTNSQPLTPDSPVPTRLIQYVQHTESVVLIDEAKTEITGVLEGYLLQYQPQSVLCLPLLHQGYLVAILYLEHPTTKGVFTNERQKIVEFLCAQAAVALQNAQLYEQAQQALRDLQKAQLQIVQSEKMSALGTLLSGVAHELNNPLGFIAGNIAMAENNLADLLEHLELYQKNTSASDIADHAEEIDLEYLQEDFPKILNSMNVGVEQMKNISTSLRIFSRKDQEHKTKFNIHDGIESTLVILKHRTKANDKRPAIQIIKEYGELSEINCFAGQLNQVFMNILANAIDAFDEANVGKTYAEIEIKPNQIKISTSRIDALQVQIEIEDNGCGMKPETKTRIFEQGYTTKGVGKGTGLGMAIVQSIITEKHGGKINCDSTVGEGTIFRIILPIA